MKINIVKKQDVIVSKWAGGESKQYYIYPPDASYASRDFLFRVSMAISNSDEEAEYSDLENFTRHLIMLEGTAQVFHENHYDIIMNPYEEIDVFDGGWKSSAIGKVTDFNLMTSKDCKGRMSVIYKNCTVVTDDSEGSRHNWLIFFCNSGKASFSLSSVENVIVTEGELLIIEDISPETKIHIKLENSKLIKMSVNC
jgi:environmental stress-induced protein Ves